MMIDYNRIDELTTADYYSMCTSDKGRYDFKLGEDTEKAQLKFSLREMDRLNCSLVFYVLSELAYAEHMMNEFSL